MRKIQKILLSLLFYAQGTALVWAQGTLLPQDECINKGTCGFQDIPRFIHYIASYLVGIAGTISVVMVMYGGYQWILSGINEAQKSNAKKTITYAIVGLVITALSWIIVNVTQVTITTS